MKIAISGSTGFIGRTLVSSFRKQNWTVQPLSRNDFVDISRLAEKIDGADVLIHLAGAPIIRRWTRLYKQEIYSSRVITTRKLAQAIQSCRNRPGLFISTSASGAVKQNSVAGENDAERDDGFIGNLCRDWEEAAFAVSGITRVVVCRLSVVFDPREGALHQMLWAFKLGIAGPIGSGKQIFSWIHIDDLVNAYHHIIQNESVTGVVHLASPMIVTNAEYTRALGRVLGRPTIIPVPVFFLKLFYGAAASVIAGGQGIIPEKLIKSGFQFQFPRLEEALRNLLT
jgi:hypothetical protein